MSPAATIEVLDGGALTSVQDARGRPGWRRFGVPVGGAADPWSARLANRLAGNPEAAPVLEATLVGPWLRFTADTVVAVAGADLEAMLDGLPIAPGVSRRVRAGGELRFGGPRTGVRAYIAAGGGIAVTPVLGSSSTDLRSGFGGHHGRPLRAGDRLTLSPEPAQEPRPHAAPRPARDGGPIRLLPGPHAAAFDGDVLARLTDGAWTVSARADRAGVRLEGSTIGHATLPEVPSLGLPPGAVQVPADGGPIVMLADRPVTGGYPVAACVIGADVGRVAQLATGDEVRFVAVTPDEAIAALARDEALLAGDRTGR